MAGLTRSTKDSGSSCFGNVEKSLSEDNLVSCGQSPPFLHGVGNPGPHQSREIAPGPRIFCGTGHCKVFPPWLWAWCHLSAFKFKFFFQTWALRQSVLPPALGHFASLYPNTHLCSSLFPRVLLRKFSLPSGPHAETILFAPTTTMLPASQSGFYPFTPINAPWDPFSRG